MLADGTNGLHVLQLVTPKDGGRSAYGFAPEPKPALIASFETHGPELAIAKGLDRDRAVDENGNQIAVFNRVGSRPFTLEEMQRLYIREGQVFEVSNEPPGPPREFKKKEPEVEEKAPRPGIRRRRRRRQR